uniref:sodium/potassium-transporting ATPase subunit beta-1-like n=1 Tax=Myxine glutinosa TaxID=7769 RepID=UPI00358E9DC8
MARQEEGGGGWKKFLWDSELQTCMGRTGSSWFKILGFYVLFYIFLGGFFMATMKVFLLTVDMALPKWTDRVLPPGLSARPRFGKSDLTFNPEKLATWEVFTKSMEDYLKQYDTFEKPMEKYVDCGVMPNPPRLPQGKIYPTPCHFYREWLGPCSGTRDLNFGYDVGQPCLIIRLNRAMDFVPEAPTNDTGESFSPNLLPVKCYAKHKQDEHLIGQVSYYGFSAEPLPLFVPPIPTRSTSDAPITTRAPVVQSQSQAGIPLQYFPWYPGKSPKRLTPLVAVQFLNLTRGQELKVECTISAANIKFSARDKNQGRLNVKFFIEE